MKIFEFVLKTLIFLVSTLFWSLIGLFIWVSLLARASIILTWSLFKSALSGSKRSDLLNPLESIVNFYPNGFNIIYHNTFGNPENYNNDVFKESMSMIRFIQELFIALLFWSVGIILIFKDEILGIQQTEISTEIPEIRTQTSNNNYTINNFGTVSISRAYLFKTDNSNSITKNYILNGTIVEILEEKDNFYYIKSVKNGKSISGYVRKTAIIR